MFVTFESTLNAPVVLNRYATFQAAFAAVEAEASFIDRDPDTEGCADALMPDGRLICIEPAARRGL